MKMKTVKKLKLSNTCNIELLNSVVDDIATLPAMERRMSEIHQLYQQQLRQFVPITDRDFADRERLVSHVGQLGNVVTMLASLRRKAADAMCSLGRDVNRELESNLQPA